MVFSKATRGAVQTLQGDVRWSLSGPRVESSAL